MNSEVRFSVAFSVEEDKYLSLMARRGRLSKGKLVRNIVNEHINTHFEDYRKEDGRSLPSMQAKRRALEIDPKTPVLEHRAFN